MLDRRKFLAILSGTVAAIRNFDLRSAAAQEAQPSPSAPGDPVKAFTFFTQPEIDFIEAAISRIIPADELGPGALEADVAFFLDQQLSGAYGHGARSYFTGPYGEESEFQGYQLPLTPRELYRVGIAATDRYAEATFGSRFSLLEPAQQDEILAGLQNVADDIDLQDVPGTTFFNSLVRDTKDGFFSDPILGGNKDKIGWRLVGYPGVSAAYSEVIFQHNQPYEVEPVSIQDLQEARIEFDQHGHPVHRHAHAGDIIRTVAPSRPKGRLAVADDWVIEPNVIV